MRWRKVASKRVRGWENIFAVPVESRFSFPYQLLMQDLAIKGG